MDLADQGLGSAVGEKVEEETGNGGMSRKGERRKRGKSRNCELDVGL